MARLRDYYKKEVVPALTREFGYKNPMEVPMLKKIVVNMGLGEAIQNVKVLDSAMQELTMIVGQKPVITKGAFDSQNLAFWDPVRGGYREFHRDLLFHRRVVPHELGQPFPGLGRMAELEEIVSALEGEQSQLEAAIQLFERGQALAARCGVLLEAAELKVKQVAGDVILPFEEESE